MLRKECPWCHNPIAMRLLGQRPTKLKFVWYQFTKYVKVCPYCANPVKPGGKPAKQCLFLLLPLFFLFVLDVFFNLVVPSYWYLGEISWTLACIAVLVFFGCTNFKRMRPHSKPHCFSVFCVAPCVRIVVASNFCTSVITKGLCRSNYRTTLT